MEALSDSQMMALAFAAWSVVVAYGVRILSALRADVRSIGKELHQYMVKTESRIAVLESMINNKIP